jgi:prepilin-type N-terminal cleavage/methylation domain-containing protein
VFIRPDASGFVVQKKMQKKRRQSGMTLTELLVVIAVMAILMSISVPTAKKLMDSFDASTGVRQLINAALCNGRAIAIREQAYAGVRFQGKDGVTYMVLIVHDYEGTGNYAYGFRAVVGRKPMALPEDVTVPSGTTIIFSPAGKLTTHSVQCLHTSANDSVFNTQGLVDLGSAMFVEDSVATSSWQQLAIWANDWSSTEHISPYTGELVIEYK